MQSKMVFKICEEISCYSVYVKEFDVIVHEKIFFMYKHINCFAILCPKSLSNLVIEVRTRHSHQIFIQDSPFRPIYYSSWVNKDTGFFGTTP